MTDETTPAPAEALLEAMFDAPIAAHSPSSRVLPLVRGQSSRIVLNWALRVATLPAFRAQPNMGLAELQRSVPEMLTAALNALETPDWGIDPDPLQTATAFAERHGARRADEGFPISLMLEELQQLRIELGSAIHRAADAQPQADRIGRELPERLNLTFDAMINAAATAWTERRAGS